MPYTFTDDPLLPRITFIRALHIAELRTAIDNYRSTASLGGYAWTGDVFGGVLVQAVHVEELRTALDQARSALGLSALVYDYASLAGHSVTANQLQQLRDALNGRVTASVNAPAIGASATLVAPTINCAAIATVKATSEAAAIAPGLAGLVTAVAAGANAAIVAPATSSNSANVNAPVAAAASDSGNHSGHAAGGAIQVSPAAATATLVAPRVNIAAVVTVAATGSAQAITPAVAGQEATGRPWDSAEGGSDYYVPRDVIRSTERRAPAARATARAPWPTVVATSNARVVGVAARATLSIAAGHEASGGTSVEAPAAEARLKSAARVSVVHPLIVRTASRPQVQALRVRRGLIVKTAA